MSKIADVLEEVFEERLRQDGKWGEQNHEMPEYFAILAEEFGEAAKVVVELRFGRVSEVCDRLSLLREELVQTAAVAVAMVEAIDRRLQQELPLEVKP